uniref:HsdS n=1 Tax=Lactococcus lactis TaxID=1358 RepID=Q93K28_9LACT|nr:HsdS' [Lactococcus lactis]
MVGTMAKIDDSVKKKVPELTNYGYKAQNVNN